MDSLADDRMLKEPQFGSASRSFVPLYARVANYPPGGARCFALPEERVTAIRWRSEKSASPTAGIKGRGAVIWGVLGVGEFKQEPLAPSF